VGSDPNTQNRQAHLLQQWFPTGVSRTVGVRNNIFGVRDAILEGESLYVIAGYTFFQNYQDLRNLPSSITKKTLYILIIPAHVTCLTNYIGKCVNCYFLLNATAEL